MSRGEAPRPPRWNPYIVAYAIAHGRSVTAMLEADEEDWPGGRMTGFLLWMSRRWERWGELRGHRRHDFVSEEDRAHFEGWLRGTALARAETLAGPISSRGV